MCREDSKCSSIMKGKQKLKEKFSRTSMFASIHRQRVKSLSSKLENDKKSFFRVAIHGAGKVGKSCIIDRLMRNEFSENHTPTVSEVYEKELKYGAEILGTFWLYDTAGSMDFPVMNRLTITKSDACVVVYAVDCLKSFEKAQETLTEIQTMKGKNFPCVLVGNKKDTLTREVTFEKGLKCAVNYGASYVETSAKDDINILDIFESVTKKIHHYEQLFQYKKRIGKSFSSQR